MKISIVFGVGVFFFRFSLWISVDCTENMFIIQMYWFFLLTIDIQSNVLAWRCGQWIGTLSSGNAQGDGNAETCKKIGERTPLWQKLANIIKAAPSETTVSALPSLLTLLIFILCLSGWLRVKLKSTRSTLDKLTIKMCWTMTNSYFCKI